MIHDWITQRPARLKRVQTLLKSHPPELRPFLGLVLAAWVCAHLSDSRRRLKSVALDPSFGGVEWSTLASTLAETLPVTPSHASGKATTRS